MSQHEPYLKEYQDKVVRDVAKSLRRLRLTEVGGRKENPCDTVASVLRSRYGADQVEAASEYIARAAIRAYHKAANL